MSITFTVFFEDPFWVGLLAIKDDNAANYARVVFGKEPSINEVYEFFHKNFNLLKFCDSPALVEEKEIKNPQRRQREISKELHNRIGTKKSYEAIKLILEQDKKKEDWVEKKVKRAEREKYIFDLKQKKYKEKHRGR